MPVRNKVRNQAATAQMISEQNRDLTDNALGAYMRRSLLGSHFTPKNKDEALGRMLGVFLRQGANEWKANYDLRGDFNRDGEEFLRRQLRGEQLNPNQAGLLGDFRSKYPDRYNELEARLKAELSNVDASQQPPSNSGLLGERTPLPDLNKLPEVSTPFENLPAEKLSQNIPSAESFLLRRFTPDELARLF